MVAIAALLTVSCRDADVASPGATPTSPSDAKAATGAPTVSSTEPSHGRQGTVALDVRILGRGFDATARASWQKNGQIYSKIVVNSTRYVSSTELVAKEFNLRTIRERLDDRGDLAEPLLDGSVQLAPALAKLRGS